jgi:glyoxylase-like metal-dependent hydrolase (beta-lactamase superfamily II)
MHLQPFVFNDFQENTYVLWDDTLECVIIDPGCFYEEEKEKMLTFIEVNRLQPVFLLNTHCHLDHVFGNARVKKALEIPFLAHRDDLFLLQSMSATAAFYGFTVEPSPTPDRFIGEGDEVKFGNTLLKVIHTPGHSPGSVCFINDENKTIIGGDVLFQGSIGRFDLPGGDYQVLMQSITEKLLTLPEEYKIYSGHGPVTTIKAEKKMNPFVLEFMAEAKGK